MGFWSYLSFGAQFTVSFGILSMLGTPGTPGTPGMGSILGPRNHLDEESVRWLSAATLAPWTPWNFTNENCWM